MIRLFSSVFYTFLPVIPVYFVGVPSSGQPQLKPFIWLLVKLAAAALGFSPVAAPLPVSESSSEALKYNSRRVDVLMALQQWWSLISKPLAKGGFKAPQACHGQHYHVLLLCARFSSSLMLIGRLLLSGLELSMLEGTAKSPLKMDWGLTYLLHEPVTANLLEKWVPFSTHLSWFVSY